MVNSPAISDHPDRHHPAWWRFAVCLCLAGLTGCQQLNFNALVTAAKSKPSDKVNPSSIEKLSLSETSPRSDPLEDTLSKDRWTRRLIDTRADLLERCVFQPHSILKPQWIHAGWNERLDNSFDDTPSDLPSEVAVDSTGAEVNTPMTPPAEANDPERVQSLQVLIPSELTPQQVSSLQEFLDQKRLSAVNASILLAHHLFQQSLVEQVDDKNSGSINHRQLATQLTAFLRTPSDYFIADSDQQTTLAVRQAAAEALVLCCACNHAVPVESRFAPAGRLVDDKDLPVQVRQELVRTLSPWMAPDRLPGWSSLSYDSPPELISSLADCFLIHDALSCRQHMMLANAKLSTTTSKGEWMWGLRWHQNPSIRKRFGQWVALIQSEQAMEILQQHQKDHSVEVRLAAIESLGLLKNPAAFRKLKDLLADANESHRLAAFRGLRYLTDPEAVSLLRTIRSDDAATLRKEVAVSLKYCHSQQCLPVMLQLASDSDYAVQNALLSSVAGHPESVQEPLYWALWKHGYWAIRLKATDALVGMGYSRQQIQAHIQGDYQQRHAFVMTLAAVNPNINPSIDLVTDSSADKQPAGANRSEIDSLLKMWSQSSTDDVSADEVKAKLKACLKTDLVSIETAIQDMPVSEQQRLIDDVLRDTVPLYLSLTQLNAQNLHQRRKASRSIAAESQNRSLPAFVRQKIVEHLNTEHDRLVWNDLIAALGSDQTEEYRSAVLMALGSQWADLRLLGCEHMKALIQSRDCAVLLPLIEDESRQVRLQAIELLGHAQSQLAIHGMQLPDQQGRLPGLSSLIDHPDAEIRFAAIVGLSRLGYHEGQQRLVNQLHNSDPVIRYQAIDACSQLKAHWAIAELFGLLWTESKLDNQRLLLKSIEELTTEFDSKPAVPSNLSLTERILYWQQWWEEEQK